MGGPCIYLVVGGIMTAFEKYAMQLNDYSPVCIIYCYNIIVLPISQKNPTAALTNIPVT